MTKDAKMMLKITCLCLWIYFVLLRTDVSGLAETSNLRQLMQNHPENQNLIEKMGTRYEIVYPVQYRQDWVRGLSTRDISRATHEGAIHLQKTSVIIETLSTKFHLDLELNSNLLAPTLIQMRQYYKTEHIAKKKIENCYYHATIRNYTDASAALRTCFGISGVIYLKNEMFIIQPLHGDDSINHPHLLYHYVNKLDDGFSCGNKEVYEMFHCALDQSQAREKRLQPTANRYVELALFLDKSFFEKFVSTGKDAVAEAIQIVNGADLILRSLNTSLTVVYLEIWAEEQLNNDTLSGRLSELAAYVARKLTWLTVDASHLITGNNLNDNYTGLAQTDTICTTNAAAITKIGNVFNSHIPSVSVTHMLGHNLGMYHDENCCTCQNSGECLMKEVISYPHELWFSSCSIQDYYRTMNKGFGECLYNMPKMRESVCGNSVLEKGEECDCGSAETCQQHGSCCNPMTCKFIKHAECFQGPCCKKCKLLSMDSMCRVAKGECDIPEFCDGIHGQCPDDQYKKDGAICDDGTSYCFMGTCPSMRHQCESLWGYGGDTSHSICFERLNIHGTPNGNCGPDNKGGLMKCTTENSRCGTLQCQYGKKSPVTTEKPLEFIVNKINVNGTVYECKAIPSLSLKASEHYGLVEDGTKCGYQKFCLNSTCTKIRDTFSGSCPVGGGDHLPCFGHGVCTNTNECFCDEGWSGIDCGMNVEQIYSENSSNKDINDPKYSVESSKPNFKETLMVTIISISAMIGLALVAAILLVFCKSKNLLNEKTDGDYHDIM